ncbi:MAG: hypothetical protein CSA20_08755 [Deltaproteobacteria bacterium]|nr:MAG: hypothetical protein CSA20_08755 [Deltaproteobacteria bacterium]
MKKLFLLFNHSLTAEQEADARISLCVEQIVTAPKEIAGIWAQLPPDIESLVPYLQPIRTWLETETRPGDIVLVQGDFGAVYLMVVFLKEIGCVPVYATTRRKAVERLLDDGTVELSHSFRHVRFRKYGF